MNNFVALSADRSTIHGLGDTPAEARADAERTSGEDPGLRPWLVVPATQRLIGTILRTEPAPVRWHLVDGVADLMEPGS